MPAMQKYFCFSSQPLLLIHTFFQWAIRQCHVKLQLYFKSELRLYYIKSLVNKCRKNMFTSALFQHTETQRKMVAILDLFEEKTAKDTPQEPSGQDKTFYLWRKLNYRGSRPIILLLPATLHKKYLRTESLKKADPRNLLAYIIASW